MNHKTPNVRETLRSLLKLGYNPFLNGTDHDDLQGEQKEAFMAFLLEKTTTKQQQQQPQFLVHACMLNQCKKVSCLGLVYLLLLLIGGVFFFYNPRSLARATDVSRMCTTCSKVRAETKSETLKDTA